MSSVLRGVVGSALRGRKIVCIQVRTELSGEDGVLLPDRFTHQGDDLAAGDRLERRGMAPAREIPEAFEALAQESPAPAFAAPDGTAQARRDLTRAPAFGARQNDSRPRDVPLCGWSGLVLGRTGRSLPRASARGAAAAVPVSPRFAP